MSFREKPAPRPIPQGQSTLASYLHGVVPISVPQNPSLPPAPRTPFAPYRRLFTGLPVDPVLETEANPPTSGMYLTLTVDTVAEICLVPPCAVTASLQWPLLCHLLPTRSINLTALCPSLLRIS